MVLVRHWNRIEMSEHDQKKKKLLPAKKNFFRAVRFCHVHLYDNLYIELHII